MLVGYWFKYDLQRITQRLNEVGIPYERLDSEASMKRWNAGQIQVGLAHPASTGHGLNLQNGGNTICWFSPTWSLELYQLLKALAEKDRIQEALIDAVKAEVNRGGR